VLVVRDRDDDGVDVLLHVQHPAEVAVLPRLAVLPRGGGEVAGVHVAERNDVCRPRW